MSDENARFTNGDVAMAFLSAWLIGFGTASGVAIFASGKVNWQGMTGAAIAGLVTAAKDYRSLKRLPNVTNGGSEVSTVTTTTVSAVGAEKATP